MPMHPFMFPTAPNDADVSDELCERALKRTATMLREVEQIRRTLELPVEQLPVVIETYNQVVITLLAEEGRKKIAARTTRLPMTLRSDNRDGAPMKILTTQTVDVSIRPQTWFRPEDLAIRGDRSRWMVHDIRVGNRSQFAGKRGPAAGTEFGPGGICEHLRLETCQTGMDLTLTVEYVGPEESGEVFEAVIVGKAFEF